MRIRYETRLAAHERNCRGLRDFWHTLIGEHVRIARWDYEESSFMFEAVWERYQRRWMSSWKFVSTPDPTSGEQK